jgi:16S rRNA (adenine1518-N6/adenine1519-N6)-dimethyltransferase
MYNNQGVRAKKHLGQHFLKDESVARAVADSFDVLPGRKVIEVGPGTGMLTKYLIEKDIDLKVSEIDRESIAYLEQHYPGLEIIRKDFLQLPLADYLDAQGLVIGNFPYNISSQILFHCLEHRPVVKTLCGMFQKEVAERIAASHGNKTYGILSVLVQTYYETEYLFTVEPQAFTPPPKVRSAVIRLERKNNVQLPVTEQWLRTVVKTAFNQRRKTLRNALRPLLQGKNPEYPLLQKRAEQLDISQFVELATWLQTI